LKGIISAGGSGTRLYPITKAISKQINPIYDKPMIYYPLSVLMLADIREVLIISTPRDLPTFKELLGDGSDLGMKLEYAVQENPNGLAEVFIIGEGQGLRAYIKKASKIEKGAYIFGYPVKDPKRFGVVEFDEKSKIISLEEKPINPKSNFAVPGLYFYDNTVTEKAKMVKPSYSEELEITTLNKMYLDEETLKVINLGRGMAWLDTGTHDSLLEASNFVRTVQHNQGLFIACLEEIAYNNGWITKEDVIKLAQPLLKTHYGEYLMGLVR